ncbi:MAG: hypothetical protein ACKERG_01120 [Candidatus Hodgkinia cicadicola]
MLTLGGEECFVISVDGTTWAVSECAEDKELVRTAKSNWVGIIKLSEFVD